MHSFEGRRLSKTKDERGCQSSGGAKTGERGGSSRGGVSQSSGSGAALYVYLIDAWAERALLGGRRKLDVRPWATVREVKAKLQRLLQIPVARQRLFWRSRELRDHRSLEECGIHRSGTTLLFDARASGLDAPQNASWHSTASSSTSLSVMSSGGLCLSSVSQRREGEPLERGAGTMTMTSSSQRAEPTAATARASSSSVCGSGLVCLLEEGTFASSSCGASLEPVSCAALHGTLPVRKTGARDSSRDGG